MADTEFNHHISRDQYAAGLKAELATATDKDHKAAVKAELDALIGETAVQPPKEQA